MAKRFLAIWFRHLLTDWKIIRQPDLKEVPFVFATSVSGRRLITAASTLTERQGVIAMMPLADAKAIVPALQVFEDRPGRAANLLRRLGEWAIRYTPIVAVDLPDGLLLDISGCAHLWGGEREYLKEIIGKLRTSGYDVRGAIADTAGAAWAVSRFGKITPIIEAGDQVSAIGPLPPAALRLEPLILERLQKLGLNQVSSFITMSRKALRRRFGDNLLLRLDQAIGQQDELIKPIQLVSPYQERLPCLEPIRTAKGIEMAIQHLLDSLCLRLQKESKGVRTAILKCYRVDGKVIQVEIGTNRATYNAAHLFSLFDLKIPTIEPALGIEVFVLEAPGTEEVNSAQEKLWAGSPGLESAAVAELLDRLAGKLGKDIIHRYLPDTHHWPERSFKDATSLQEQSSVPWHSGKPRPVQLLARPERIEVAAPVPDYPPMLFRHRGKVHHIKRSDGPERIEQEWWLEDGEHRDYYNVEDQDGQRYWVFRAGHYEEKHGQWYLHGFFA